MKFTLLIGSFLIIITVFIHSAATKFVISYTKKEEEKDRKSGKYHREIFISKIILLMFFASILEAIVWACCYILIGAITGFQKALYFSIVSLTTLGYGDVILAERWQLLGSFEAAAGIVIFGWTTAIVMISVQALYFNKKIK